MYQGRRTQNSAPNNFHRHRTQELPARTPATNDLAAASRSAARRAAEAAFDAPQVQSLPQHPAQVFVRRSRAAGFAAKAVPEQDDVPNVKATAKASRVFRVAAAQVPRTAETADLASRSPMETSACSGGAGAHTPALPSARRVATDKRPGPVLQVVHALPERRRETAAPQPRPALLIAETARLEPALKMLAPAQAFSLVDERVVREWRGLARKIDDLHAQIRARMR